MKAEFFWEFLESFLTNTYGLQISLGLYQYEIRKKGTFEALIFSFAHGPNGLKKDDEFRVK